MSRRVRNAILDLGADQQAHHRAAASDHDHEEHTALGPAGHWQEAPTIIEIAANLGLAAGSRLAGHAVNSVTVLLNLPARLVGATTDAANRAFQGPGERYAAAVGRTFVWVVGPWRPPPDIRDELERHPEDFREIQQVGPHRQLQGPNQAGRH